MSSMPIANWQPHLSLGITGHRAANPSLVDHREAVAAALSDLFTLIAQIEGALPGDRSRIRLHSLLVDGIDQMAAELALGLGWDLVAPLPFGADLNLAINAQPGSVADAAALCSGQAATDAEVDTRARKIRGITSSARLFELSDRDAEVEMLFKATLDRPDDRAAARAFDALCSDNVGLAGRVMIERTDLIIAVWDGKVSNLPGGTGHTVATALATGTPVLIIDPANPGKWSIHSRPEELGNLASGGPGVGPEQSRLESMIRAAVLADGWNMAALERERWRERSSRIFGFYRRIERVFGGQHGLSGPMRVTYETPQAFATGSAASLLVCADKALAGDDQITLSLRDNVLPMFAWADGVASRLSDAYRSGMCFNFLLAALAVIVGMAYFPLGLADQKWIFAGVELLFLCGILLITYVGSRLAWHRRWFEVRRVAEYMRHAPSLLLLGVSRSTGRWPRGRSTEWPEHFSRHCLRNAGLPRIRLTRDYLRTCLTQAVLPHVAGQRTYHEAKAERLEKVHHRLDKTANACFTLAVLSVLAYLLLKLGGSSGLLPKHWAYATSPLFTFLGVAFPTLGANLAGVRYFGDFERFAAISRVTQEKLGEIEARIGLLLAGTDEALTYAAAADLVHALDEAVVDEIESWQAVFGAKHLSLPA